MDGETLSWGFDYYKGDLRWFIYDTGNAKSAKKAWNMSLNTPYLRGANYDGTNLKSYVDQSLFVSANHTGTIDNTNDGIMIGGRTGTPALWLDGDIAEILIYDTALSDTDREAVEQYLGEKWGIILE